MISVLVRCRDDVQQALLSYWRHESFSIDTEATDGKMIAGVIHSLPAAPMVNWNEQAQEFLSVYLQQTRDFVQQLMRRNQRPSVCIVVSSSAVYGSQVQEIKEGHSVASNVWADWIVQYENVFSSLEQVGIRVVYIRSGVILSKQRIPSAHAYAGKKEDWISWVSSLDLCRFIDHCLRLEQAKGVYHLASPRWIQKNACIRKKRIGAFSKLRSLIQKESIFSPSQKVVSRKITEIGFCLSEGNIVKSKN